MRDLNDDLKAVFMRSATQMARCWQITRRDGSVLGLSDHDEDIYFDDICFHARAGMRISAIEQRAGFSVHGLDVEGVIGSPHLTSADLESGLYDGAALRIWLVDWKTPENRVQLARGVFGDVRIEGGQFTVALNAPTIHLQSQRGRVYQTTCDATLGDTKCSFNVAQANYKLRTKLRGIYQTRLDFDTLAQKVGWFVGGEIRLADGRHFTIRDEHASAKTRHIILWQTPPADLKSGIDVELVAGCDKRFETCQSKFSNALNFQGFPDLPTEDVLVSVKPE